VKFKGKDIEVSRDIIDQCDNISSRIQNLPPIARLAIAVEAAKRLMNQYLELPPGCQLPLS
jgi:hypothetical protein